MTDLPPDRLRDALRQAGQTWVPTRPPSEARARLMAGLDRRRRHRKGAMLSAGLAAVLVLLLVPMVVARDERGQLLVQGNATMSPAPAGGSAVPPAPGDVGPGDAVVGRQAGPAGGENAPGANVAPVPESGRSTGASSTTTTTTEAPASPATNAGVTNEPVGTGDPVVIAAASGVEGTVRISPVCPVEQDPPDPACAPRPAGAEIRLLRDGAVVASGRAGDDGDFQIDVRPGRYVIEATRPGFAVGSGCQVDPGVVDVAAGVYSTVSVMCDSGIR